MTKSYSDDLHDQAIYATWADSRSHGGTSGLELAAISPAEATYKWGRTGQLRLDVWIMQFNTEFEHVPLSETQEQLAETS